MEGSTLGIFRVYEKSKFQTTFCFPVEESMFDAVLNVALFAALVLCIVGFSAWAYK